MATAAPPGKSVHLYRLLTLTIDQGNIVVRNIFDQAIGNIPLQQFLTQEKRDIKRLRAKKMITKVQYDELYPPSDSPPPTTADFDLTLLFCLLRNLNACGLNPNFNWNAPPELGNTSLEADLRRMQMFRNMLAHISSTHGMNQTDFTQKWSETEQVLNRLNGSLRQPVLNLQQDIDHCKTEHLDPEAQEHIEKHIESMQSSIVYLKSEMQDIIMKVSCIERRIDQIEVLKKIEEIPDNKNVNICLQDSSVKCLHIGPTAMHNDESKDALCCLTDEKNKDIDVLEQAYATTGNEGHKGTMKHEQEIFSNMGKTGILSESDVIRMNYSSNTENDEYNAAAQDDQKMFMNMNGKPRMKKETETLSDQGTNNSGHRGFGFRIQQDNTLRVAHVIQYAEKSLSVGFLSYQNGGGGTAFRIGPKHVMTASHVVDYITDPHQVKVYDFSQVNTKARVRFGDSNARRFALKGLDIFTSRELDITILELDDGDLPYAPPPLKLLSHNVFENKSICDVAIIGYGHPNTEDKCVTHSARILHKDSVSETIQYILGQWKIQRVKACLQGIGKNPDIVDKGYNGYDCPHTFLFDTYVGPGSSGSPIFTKANPSSLEVVGVYTCGYPELAYHLPDTDQYPKDWTFESGVRMSSIYEAIRLENQTLRQELFGDLK